MQGLILENDVTTLENYHDSENVVVVNQVFDERNYTLTDLRIDSSTNEVLLARPQVNWLNTQGTGLIMSTTGSCIVYVSQFDEFWLLGGRVDPNPQQSGDEGPTQVVQRFDNANKTWTPASHTMVNEQQYHGCAKHGNKVVTIEITIPAAIQRSYPQGWCKFTILRTQLGTKEPTCHLEQV